MFPHFLWHDATDKLKVNQHVTLERRVAPTISTAPKPIVARPSARFLAWQIASDDADELVFAHDTCQGGMLVGIRHDVF